MTERRSDGVGARSVAPGLPPTSNDGIEGKTATAHKARKIWNGLIQGRRSGACCGGSCGWCGWVSVGAVAGVVWREVVGGVPRRWRSRRELQSESREADIWDAEGVLQSAEAPAEVDQGFWRECCKCGGVEWFSGFSVRGSGAEEGGVVRGRPVPLRT